MTENNEVGQEANAEKEASKPLKTEETSEEIAPKEDDNLYKNKYLYLAAETENMKKRFQKEKDNLLKYGNEKILSELLDVVDNLERTLTAIEKEEDEAIKNVFTGVSMVNTQFLEILKKFGLTQVESTGKIFDPKYHEAISQKVTSDVEDQMILEEYQKGYILNGRLVRAAKVIVAKNTES